MKPRKARGLLLLNAVLLSFAAVLPAAAQDAGDATANKHSQVASDAVPAGNAQNTGGSADKAAGQVEVAQNVQTAAEATPLSAQTSLETVVVTARYRAEDVSKVPVAISVVSGDALRESNIFNISQITQLVPSLQIQGINPRNQTIAIRGLGANPGLTTEGFEPGVGLYIDGVYYARPASVLFDQFDLNDVEVVRGPQGTLFGKNTTAGAISITTNAPSFTTGATAQISYGNYNFKQIDGSVTGAITDTLAARLTLGDTTRDDTIKTSNPNVSNKGLHNQSARLQFLWQPTDDLHFRLIGDYSHQNFTGPHQVVSSALPTTLADGTTVLNLYGKSAQAGYTPLYPVAQNPFARVSDINQQNFWNQDSHGVSLEGDWALPGDSWLAGDTITSISSWREFELFPQYDSDYLGVDYYSDLYVHIKQSQYSQEIRLASAGNETVDYTAGAYFFLQRSPVDSHSIYGTQAAQFNYGAATNPAVLNGVDNHYFLDADDGSYSVYGQATWHIDPQWSVLGGIRYTYEDKYGYNVTGIAGNYAPISSLPAAQQATAITRRATVAPSYNYYARWAGGAVSGTASLNYQVNDNVLTYVTYSRGFQSAGLNLAGVPSTTPYVVAPEYVDSYEIGTKSNWLDDRLTVNADLFNTAVSNYQATIYDTSLGGRSYIANAGGVRSRGAEADIRAIPFEGFSLTLSGIYDDAIYSRLSSTTCPYLYSDVKVCSLTGDPLAGVSKWAGSLTGEYSHGITTDREAYIGADWTLRSSFYSQLNDDPFSKVPGYGIVGLRAGVRTTDGHWDLSLWARNLLNQNYYNILGPQNQYGDVTAALGDPRFFGVTLKAKF